MSCYRIILSFIHPSFIRSFRSPPYDKSIASPKATSPQIATHCFLLQFPVSSLSLRSSGRCLRLLPRLPVTSILPTIFHSVKCFRKQFLCKMRPIKVPLFVFIACTIFLSFAVCNISHTIGPNDLHPSSAPHFTTVQVLVIHSPWCPGFSTIQSYAPNIALY